MLCFQLVQNSVCIFAPYCVYFLHFNNMKSIFSLFWSQEIHFMSILLFPLVDIIIVFNFVIPTGRWQKQSQWFSCLQWVLSLAFLSKKTDSVLLKKRVWMSSKNYSSVSLTIHNILMAFATNHVLPPALIAALLIVDIIQRINISDKQ